MDSYTDAARWGSDGGCHIYPSVCAFDTDQREAFLGGRAGAIDRIKRCVVEVIYDSPTQAQTKRSGWIYEVPEQQGPMPYYSFSLLTSPYIPESQNGKLPDRIRIPFLDNMILDLNKKSRKISGNRLRVYCSIDRSLAEKIYPLSLRENQDVLREFSASKDAVIIGVDTLGKVQVVFGRDTVKDLFDDHYTFNLDLDLPHTFRGALTWMVGQGTDARWWYHVAPLYSVEEVKNGWKATTGAIRLDD